MRYLKLSVALLSLIVLSGCASGGGGTSKSFCMGMGIYQPHPDDYLVEESASLLESNNLFLEVVCPAKKKYRRKRR